MSEDLWTIVDLEVRESDADPEAARLARWMITNGLARSGGDEKLVPGERAWWIASDSPTAETAALTPMHWIDIKPGPGIHTPCEADWLLRCPNCSHDFEPDQPFFDALSRWFDHRDDPPVACPSCGHERKLSLWDGPNPHAIGNLSITFWNWPRPREAFLHALRLHLARPVRMIYSYL
ncbi:MAG: zinc ribbon domain-containing protein [Planctomycetota bacterium]